MLSRKIAPTTIRALSTTALLDRSSSPGTQSGSGTGTSDRGAVYQARVIPWNEAWKYDSHRAKVLRLYKKAMRTTKDWCWHARSLECEIWELVMLRERFNKHKDEKDMIKATALLKAGEEEWWLNRHYQPFLYPYEDGSTHGGRHDKIKRTGDIYRKWSPEDRAMYPDLMEKLDKLAILRQESWDEEMTRLDEQEAELEEAGETITDSLPAAAKVDSLPPFWWKNAARGFERPDEMGFCWHSIDKYQY